MANCFRDTCFGQYVRVISNGRLFRYLDELDESLPQKVVSREDLEPQLVIPPGKEESLPGEALRESEKRTTEVSLVGWYGPEDPENPQNWLSSWKLPVTFEICLLNLAVYMASSIYVPGEVGVMQEFHTSETVATLGLSLYTIGYGVGPMLWSPLSEFPQIGRSGIYLYTLLAYTLLQLGAGFATSMPMLLIFRTLTGFMGSPALATGGATLADIYDPAKVAYSICIWGSFGVCGPVLGPILGGFVTPFEGWRWTIWIVTWLCSFVTVMLFFLMPETSAATILYRRAKRLRQATGRDNLRSQSEIDAESYTFKDHLRLLGRAFTLTFVEPVVFTVDLYTALLYGIFFTWFESFPLVFGGIYRFNLGEQGLVFIGIFVGGVITVPLYLLWIRHSIVPRFHKPTFRPEMILLPTFVGAVCLPVCLFWYGWSARQNIPWIVPIIGSGFFTVAIVTLFNSALNYLGISYPKYAASIFAGNALFRASFGAIFPLFARQLFRRLGIGPGNSLLAGVSILFLPLPFVFFKYGQKIRHLSKNARHDI